MKNPIMNQSNSETPRFIDRPEYSSDAHTIHVEENLEFRNNPIRKPVTSIVSYDTYRNSLLRKFYGQTEPKKSFGALNARSNFSNRNLIDPLNADTEKTKISFPTMTLSEKPLKNDN